MNTKPTFLDHVKAYAKALASLVGTVATALLALNLPSPWNGWVALAGVVATAVGTWAIPNTPLPAAVTPPPAVPPTPSK